LRQDFPFFALPRRPPVVEYGMSTPTPPLESNPATVPTAEQLPDDAATLKRMILELLATLQQERRDKDALRHRLCPSGQSRGRSVPGRSSIRPLRRPSRSSPFERMKKLATTLA
jgi:hypothetical protein